MSFKSLLENAESHAEEAIRLPCLKRITEDYTFSGKYGIYLIVRDERVIYIGQSDDIKARLRQHLGKGSDMSKSTLRRKVNKTYKVEAEKTKDWIKKCSMSHLIIKETQMRNLVECLLIAYYKERGAAVLNS